MIETIQLRNYNEKPLLQLKSALDKPTICRSTKFSCNFQNHCGLKVRTSLEVRRFRFEPPNDCNTKHIKIYQNILKYIRIYTNMYTRYTRYWILIYFDILGIELVLNWY